MRDTSALAVDAWAVLGVVLGAFVFGYGLLLLPQSLLGGAHVAAIGLSLLLSGLFLTEWASAHLAVSPGRRRRLSLTFAALAALLFAVFVALTPVTLESHGSRAAGEAGVSSRRSAAAPRRPL